MVAKRRKGEVAVTLTREAIVLAAMDILREDGLKGLTMRRIAAACGVQGPTLYWHFRDKDELLLVLVGNAMDQIELGDPEQEWTERLATMARSLRRVLNELPGLGDLALSPAVLSESTARVVDTWARIFLDQGFDMESATRAYFTINRFVFGFAHYEAVLPRIPPEQQTDAQRQAQADFVASLDPTLFVRYPSLVGLALFDEPSRDPSFEYGLMILLDGFRAARARLHPEG